MRQRKQRVQRNEGSRDCNSMSFLRATAFHLLPVFFLCLPGCRLEAAMRARTMRLRDEPAKKYTPDLIRHDILGERLKSSLKGNDGAQKFISRTEQGVHQFISPPSSSPFLHISPQRSARTCPISSWGRRHLPGDAASLCAQPEALGECLYHISPRARSL
jgi:hypothetical protein